MRYPARPLARPLCYAVLEVFVAAAPTPRVQRRAVDVAEGHWSKHSVRIQKLREVSALKTRFTGLGELSMKADVKVYGLKVGVLLLGCSLRGKQFLVAADSGISQGFQAAGMPERYGRPE
jgi:hypothetical protein